MGKLQAPLDHGRARADARADLEMEPQNRGILWQDASKLQDFVLMAGHKSCNQKRSVTRRHGMLWHPNCIWRVGKIQLEVNQMALARSAVACLLSLDHLSMEVIQKMPY
jgi:hypothetical protein